MSERISLSIIVTVYNVAPYLRRYLNSLINQTLARERYEVILVDDKSTDESLAICREYAAQHDNFRILALPVNTPGGVGFPANFGMKQARGEYIGFVDGDDFARHSMFAKLLEAAERHDADLAMCGFNLLYEKDQELTPAYDRLFWDFIFTKDFLSLPDLNKKKQYLRLSPVPWRKLYRRQFLTDNDISFPVGDFFFEDNPFHWFTIVEAERITAIQEPLIVHRFQREGQTTGSSLRKRFLDVAEHLATIKKFLIKKDCYDIYKMSFYEFIWSVIANIYTDGVDLSATLQDILTPEELREFLKMRQSAGKQ